MKALSLWQPWAQLVVLGVKPDETRSWPTRYRGPLLIHAALRARPNPEAVEAWAALADRGFDPVNVPRGALVGAVLLEGCSRCTRATVVPRAARVLGDYSHGRYAWRLGSATVFARPFPWSGRQGLFEVDLAYCPDPPDRPDPDRLLAALAAGGGVLAPRSS